MGAPTMHVCTKPLIYIAGPFRPKVQGNHWQIENNIRRAEELALEVWRMGGAAICPHALTRYYQGELPDATWLDGDLCILDRCDAILMTPNWKESAGATDEHKYAEFIGMPIFYTIEELGGYIDGYRTNRGYCQAAGNAGQG